MDYKSLKVVELKTIAKERGLKGYSTLLKADLIEFLKKSDKASSPKAAAPKAAAPKAAEPKAAAKSIISYFPAKIASLPKSPELLKTEYKNIFQITPSLSFIYQIANEENKGYLPDGFTNPRLNFSFQDAVDCTSNIDSPKWKIVDQYLDIFVKDCQNKLKLNVDKDFLHELLKKEVLELKKGNLTFLHSKSLQYLVLDIISQLISGSYEGFKPKCLRNLDEIDKKALEIIKELFNLPQVKKSLTKDHEKEVRKRVISSNITIFNNAFNQGESSLQLFFQGYSIMNPYQLIDYLNLSPKLKKFVLDLMNEITKLGKHLIVMYSIPIESLNKYVYPSNPFGIIDKQQEDIYKNLKEYLRVPAWKSKMLYNYMKQFRIVDLCYTKYAYKQGVRTYQITDIPIDKLETFVKKIDRNLSQEKEVNDWFIQYIDISEKKRPKPVSSIRPLKSGRLLATSASLDEILSPGRSPGRLSPGRLSPGRRSPGRRSPGRRRVSPVPKRMLPSINLEESPEVIIRAIPAALPAKVAAKVPSKIPAKVAAKVAAKVSPRKTRSRVLEPRDILIHPVPAVDYESKTVVQLKALAKEKGLKRYSALRKAELIELLKKH